MCSGSEEGSFLRLIKFCNKILYHSTIGLGAIKKVGGWSRGWTSVSPRLISSVRVQGGELNTWVPHS